MYQKSVDFLLFCRFFRRLSSVFFFLFFIVAFNFEFFTFSAIVARAGRLIFLCFFDEFRTVTIGEFYLVFFIAMRNVMFDFLSVF